MAAAEGWPATDWLKPWRPPAAADGPRRTWRTGGAGAPEAVDPAGSTGPAAAPDDSGDPPRPPADPAEARGTVSS